MIDPMVYGIILNQDSFENLMELREMTETGIMRLAILKYDAAEMRTLEGLLEDMRVALDADGESVDAFFRADNAFHDQISKMGKNPQKRANFRGNRCKNVAGLRLCRPPERGTMSP